MKMKASAHGSFHSHPKETTFNGKTFDLHHINVISLKTTNLENPSPFITLRSFAGNHVVRTHNQPLIMADSLFGGAY